ncbi:zinc ribbon domain-containing protein [Tengunoibacter tsumagoiensis]|uniref:Zinc-ribbon domain-containing protein n=1 Tax=Tengunoibacter tsumagoiensis TaxID=2014871 RepID=A0A401ZUT9_9CHLR|nr:zinc ribbon domain-containing protein [Tengunoibacter tsumagoiensis]GCE10484.1 hypothetical protein KTT_03430 [Tengunoibacter tsumagoiensis]
MYQQPSQVCSACGTPIEPGTRFCQNCGSPVAQNVVGSPSNVQPPLPPTVAATPPPPANQPYGGTPSNPGQPPYGGSGQAYGTPANQGFPQYGSVPTPGNPPVHTQYDSKPSSPYENTPPPPPSDPYGLGSAGTYSNTGYPVPPAPKKKRSKWPWIVVGIIVVVLVACIGSSYGIVNWANSTIHTTGTATATTDNNSSHGGNFAKSKDLNLTVNYADDQITFSKISQADHFDDDSFATKKSYDPTANYIRVNFTEQTPPSTSSYIDYYTGFQLVVDGGNVGSYTKSLESTGPDKGVKRDNWVDFETKGAIDLSKVKLRIGRGDEEQIEFALKSDADVSQFNPKTYTLNKKFTYAGMQWTIKDVIKSYASGGNQAKKGQVFLTIELNADNDTDNEVYLTPSDFCRMKVDGSSLSPEYSSDDQNFDIIKSRTTGITGSLVFTTKPSSTNTYTLDFQSGDNIQEVTTDFSLS